MLSFQQVAIFSSVIASLCVLILPLWILGVPGIENDYARGWGMGLNAILLYLLSYLLNYALYFFLTRMSSIGQLRYQQINRFVAIALLIVFTLRMIQAFRIIIRA